MKLEKKLVILTLVLGCIAQTKPETESERHQAHKDEAKDVGSNFGRTLALPFTAAGDAVTADTQHYTRQNIDAMENNAADRKQKSHHTEKKYKGRNRRNNSEKN